jgi:hypothetical protein
VHVLRLQLSKLIFTINQKLFLSCCITLLINLENINSCMKIKEISLLIMILIVAMMTVGIVAITDSVTGAPAKLSQANLGTNSSYTNAFMSEHCKSWSSTGGNQYWNLTAGQLSLRV